MYFFRSLGSICAYSLFCTIVFPVSLILEIVANIDSKSSIIEFIKLLYCMTRDETVYTMALTG